MKNNKLFLLVFLAVSMLIIGCKTEQREVAAETADDVVDSGSLVIETSPSLAQVYVSEEFKGDSPITLYNLPVGKYGITVKKDGYADFKKTVAIKVGKIEEVDATLTPVVEEAKQIVEKPEKEAKPENVSAPAAQLNRINLSGFAMYYDFDKTEFTELRTEGSNLFSRKYENYVHFTTLIPTKINVINKPINEVTKEDCIFADTAVVQVFSGQTICVKTGAGAVVAIGGSWQASPTELEFVSFG